MGLNAGQDILAEVCGNTIILQEMRLTQEFTNLINVYYLDHPTRGFQYSIFYPVAGHSYPLVLIPDHDRELALGIPSISKELRSHLRHGSSTAGLAPLANHTCCPHHKNSELQILSVWQVDQTSSTPPKPVAVGQGPETRRLRTEPWSPRSELRSPFEKARLSSLVVGIRHQRVPHPN